MSRAIKVRLYSKPAKQYVDYITIGFLNTGELRSYSTENGFGPVLEDDYIVEQYTGIKDKNGKEIYEGDIIRYDAIDYEVLWADYYAGFETKRLNSPWNNAGLTLHFLASVGRVIGNIHENPELLGGKK